MAEKTRDFGAFSCKCDSSAMNDGRDTATADTCV